MGIEEAVEATEGKLCSLEGGLGGGRVIIADKLPRQIELLPYLLQQFAGCFLSCSRHAPDLLGQLIGFTLQSMQTILKLAGATAGLGGFQSLGPGFLKGFQASPPVVVFRQFLGAPEQCFGLVKALLGSGGLT
ncbi:MAG: hypothetical protein D6800_14445, partial [Candidatus Zixiibacteriota bacterium]